MPNIEITPPSCYLNTLKSSILPITNIILHLLMAWRNYDDKHRDTEIYQKAIDSTCKQLKRLFKNNTLLLSLHGFTLPEQIKDMEAKGLKLSFYTIRNLKSGTNKNAALLYCNYFAIYWGYKVTHLMDRDFSKMATLPKQVNRPLCSYSIKGSTI